MENPPTAAWMVSSPATMVRTQVTRESCWGPGRGAEPWAEEVTLAGGVLHCLFQEKVKVGILSLYLQITPESQIADSESANFCK